MIKDDLGQASLDFLAGIIIFMGSLVMVMQFIPGIFTPFQTEATDLNSVAYRTGVLLLEDPGWWSNTSTNRSSTDWENHLNDNTTYTQLRLGLASLDSYNKTNPNVLNKIKLEKFANTSKDNLTEYLGLYRNISGYAVKYGYNISIYYLDERGLVKINGTNITAGDPVPAAQDIARIERLVLTHIGNIARFDASMLNYPAGDTSKTWINITGPQEENVLFEITNFNITPPPAPAFMSITSLNRGTDINNPATDYVVWKKTNTSNFVIAPTPGDIEINRTDTLRFEIKKSIFVPGPNTLTLNFKNSVVFPNPGLPADYSKYLKPNYEKTKLVVEVWQ